MSKDFESNNPSQESSKQELAAEPVRDLNRMKDLWTSCASQEDDVDQDKIERARQLLLRDGYPPTAVLERIARHLARNWPSTTSETQIPSAKAFRKP